MTAVPADDTIPVHITDTVTRGRMTPTYPVIAYPHAATGGDAIAGGIVYHGDRIPALKGKLLLGRHHDGAHLVRGDEGRRERRRRQSDHAGAPA